ncbi:hypothetical protein M422DRAFT_53479 [Sphaerobolus stellatus SS14]|uniref:Uncharacterized protein n=1 Tax=Sphaerobolus stellatus (strain SS14) TaxID=990650 RepID=A0A0C9UTV0_SPHS4|nr:hypothetical protein M422DRAFT_54549 [Sphaerobolus stellatus SS14]KIJ31308.1 hypothetical protein M422DRAFT_53479 [Sphaerobolus stellatus SS14]
MAAMFSALMSPTLTLQLLGEYSPGASDEYIEVSDAENATGKHPKATSKEKQGPPKNKSCQSGADALQSMSDAVEALTATIQADSGNPGGMQPSPQCHTMAYQMAEAQEELSDNELAGAAEVFTDTKAADEYLSFKNKAARKIWLNHKIECTFNT